MSDAQLQEAGRVINALLLVLDSNSPAFIARSAYGVIYDFINEKFSSESRDYAKKLGLIFSSIDELLSKYGKDGEIKKIGDYQRGGKRLIYKKGELFKVFYLCQNCGIIEGLPKEEPFDDIHGLAGKSGFNYICYFCKKDAGIINIGFA